MPPRQNTARRRQAEPASTQALFSFMDGLVPPAAAASLPSPEPAAPVAAPRAAAPVEAPDAAPRADSTDNPGDAPFVWDPDPRRDECAPFDDWDGREVAQDDCPSFDDVPPAWLDEAAPPDHEDDRYRAPAWLDEAPLPQDDGRDHAGSADAAGWGWDIDPREIPYGAAPADNGWDAAQPVSDAVRAAVDGVLDGLNPEQREAATTIEGPLLVVAGAGTGKTRVLTTRIAHLIASGYARASQILAVTFTNKAAREMRERIEGLIGDEARQLRMGSFHSMSMAMLRRHPVSAGLRDQRFSIVDEDDQEKLVERAMRAVGLTDTESQGKGRSKAWKDRISEIHKRIQDWKEEGLTVEDLRARGVSAELDIVLAVYDTYQKDLLARNACDFADLLLHMVVLFRKEPSIRALWASRYRYVLVDEFQDTNRLQYEWLTHLAQDHHNLCAVGDLDQCIYEWRGAKPSIFMGFKDDWAPCKVVTVDQNYRSTTEILEIANLVVAVNPRPVPKSLRSNVSGEAPRLDVYETHTDEADGIAAQIAKRIALGQSPNEMAILVRTSRPMLHFEQALTRRGLNYSVVGGMKFHERMEIKDALCYLRIALDPRDEFAFRRIANTPTRDVGGATLDKVVAAQLTGKAADFAEACLWAADNAPRIPAKAKEGLRDLARVIREAQDKAAEGLRPGRTIAWLLERVGYFDWRKKMEDESLHEREENVAELIQDADEYSDPAVYLQNMATLGQADAADEGTGTVRISTIHAAKGLEFRTVWTPAMEEEILPNARAMRDRKDGLAEERRICHVAWTRAKRELIASYAEQRHFQMTLPSRFLCDVGLIKKAKPAGGAQPVQAQPPAPRPAFNAAAGTSGGYTFRRFTPPPR